ncbi:MAG TPA: alpha/beta hydrolase-fold protein [Polyangiaceae bacterium]
MIRAFGIAVLAFTTIVGCSGSSSDAANEPDAGAGPSDGGDPPAKPGASVDGGAPSTLPTTINVHYPRGGSTIAIRGTSAPLASDHGLATSATDANTVTLVIDAPAGSDPISFVPWLDDATVARGPAYTVPAGQTIDVWPHFKNQKGTLTKAFAPFHSNVLTVDPADNDQAVWVYMPPSYDENTLLRYPVVYMHDGQNLWVDADSTTGVAWHVDTQIDAAIEAGTMDEVIVVAPEHGTYRQRIYAPVTDPGYPQSSPANGGLYAQMVVTELKPAVDARFRTRSGREDTAALGSSLGGLMTAFEGLKYPGTFGLLGEMSPSAWWFNDWIVFQIDGASSSKTLFDRIYVDQGVDEGVLNAGMLVREYQLRGYDLGENLTFYEEDGAQHDEAAWGRRIPLAMHALFPPTREAIVGGKK